MEVDRPNRRKRRRLGTSDPIDAEAAARAALSGEASVTPKWRDGTVEQIRVLMVARRSARMQRNQALNQLRQIVICAPGEIRSVSRIDTRLAWCLRWLRCGPVRVPTR